MTSTVLRRTNQCAGIRSLLRVGQATCPVLLRSRRGADLAPETWVRTSFSRIHEGALVNLELPMKAGGRFGGHIVQGHVDGVGKLISFDRIADSENWWLNIELTGFVRIVRLIRRQND